MPKRRSCSSSLASARRRKKISGVRLEALASLDDECLLVAGEAAERAGFLVASRMPVKRVRHCFRLVIGVAEPYWGQGIGRRLIEEVEGWIRQAGGTRIELSVVASNQRARWLYERGGFVVEGTRGQGMQIDGPAVDELYMARLL